MNSRNGLLKIVLLSVVAMYLTAGTVRAANEIFIESKTFPPNAPPGQRVGVFVTNVVPITAIDLPLELREITPGSYVKSSFTFGLNPSGRVYNSPLGPGCTEPPAVTTLRYPTPGGTACSTPPVYSTYETPAPQIDFASPDGVLYVTISTGALPPCISMAAGTDLPNPAQPVTADASFWFTFDVTAVGGSFMIDTCCVRPANHLTFVPEGPYLEASPFITPSFTPGVITIAAGSVPVPCCTDFNDNALHGYSPCPNGAAVSILVMNGGPGGLGDPYLHATDLSGPSLICAGPDCLGDWTAVAASECDSLCYDAKLFNDGGATPGNVHPNVILDGTAGPGTTGAPLQAVFHVTTPAFITVTSGWHHICAPIAFAQSGGPLPSNSYGHWEMYPLVTPVVDAANWNALIDGVTGMEFLIDFTPNPSEEMGYDNICLGMCPDTCNQVILLLNTGYNHYGVPPAIYGLSAQDLFWQVVSDPIHPITSGGHPATVIPKNLVWANPATNSQWIAAHPGENNVAPGGFTEFQFCFCLPLDFANATLYMNALVDDFADVFLNGFPTPILSIHTPLAYQLPAHSVTVTGDSKFLPGRNCIRVKVENGPLTATGINIEGYVTQGNASGVGLKECCDSCSISGVKFFDANQNGVQDFPLTVDIGLPGWTVTLNWYNGPVFTSTITTAPNGAYTFSGIPCASWSVTEAIPSPWVQTLPAPTYYAFSLLPGANVTNKNFGNWRCSGIDYPKSAFATSTDTCCLKPPYNMVLWLPFDEPAGGKAANNACGGNHGTHYVGVVPTALPVVLGKVGNALSFNGVDTYVDVNSYDAIFEAPDPGTGDFTLDAWVKLPLSPPIISGVRIIVSKSTKVGNVYQGYELYLVDGVLRCLLEDGQGLPSYTEYFSGQLVPQDDLWHHVAVTVDRDNVMGGQFYYDGGPVGTVAPVVGPQFDPSLRPGSLSNTAPFRVGAISYSVASVFNGYIDEVEMFRRALTVNEIQAIYRVGMRGKCKSFCMVPWDEPFCSGDNSIMVTAQICNATSGTKTYHYDFLGMGQGSGCSITGPTVFTPPNGTVTVLARQCVPVTVTIDRPGGMNADNQVGCYQMVLKDQATGEITTCHGSVQDKRNTCLRFPSDAYIGIVTSVDTLTASARVPVSLGPIVVTNGRDTQDTLDYQIVVMDDEMNTDMSAVKLNGLPPGTPVTGSVTLDSGASTTIDLTAEFMEYNPLHWYTILAQYDADGDSSMDDPLASAGFRNVIQSTDCVCPCAGDPQCDGVIADVLDVVVAVGVAFRGQLPVTDPICPRERTDVDCNGVTDVLDVVHTVAVAFRNGNSATEFCDPCL